MPLPHGWTGLSRAVKMTCLIEPEHPEQHSRIQFRMAWRLMLCLFGHLALLFFLALYLVASLNQVQLYTPEARADEVQLESVKAVPALLAAMNTQRARLPEERRPARTRALPAGPRRAPVQPRLAPHAADFAERPRKPAPHPRAQVGQRDRRLRRGHAQAHAGAARCPQRREHIAPQPDQRPDRARPERTADQAPEFAGPGGARRRQPRHDHVGLRGHHLLRHGGDAVGAGELDHRPDPDADRRGAAPARRRLLRARTAAFRRRAGKPRRELQRHGREHRPGPARA